MDKKEFDKLKLLIEPCLTAEALDNYLRAFLKLELPWDTVDEDSTSAPLKFVWQVYNVLLTGKGPTRHVVAAARNTTKTLTSSIIQFLSLLHFRRDGAHIAAILDQSLTSIRYLDSFLGIPELAPYRLVDNARTKRLLNLPANDYTKKSEATLRVVTATKKGANSPRASLLTLDEVDLTPKEILSEVAYVADPTRDGHRFDPVFIYLSSRKSNDGPIQDLIDKAERSQINLTTNSRIKLHKWSTVDFMEKCADDIHLPEHGPQVAYIHTETLETIWGKEDFEAKVAGNIRGQWKEVSAWEGCKSCPAFIACQGRSVKQRGTSGMLRSRNFVGDVLEAVGDPQVIVAQSLNWKPESTSLVFRSFSYHRNVKDPIEFYEWAIGERFNPDGLEEAELDRIIEDGTKAELRRITPKKTEIYEALVKAGWTICYGVDWGFKPDPSVVVVAGFHRTQKRCCVIHVESAYEHANNVWADYISTQIWPYMPGEHLAPDMADPASPTYFAKHNVPSLRTKPPRIETGVSFIRSLLWNPILQSTSFCILDDSDGQKHPTGQATGNAIMIEEFQRWTHKKTALGWDFNKFEENKWNHTIDALRYALDPFIQDLHITIKSAQPEPEIHTNLDDYRKSREKAIAEEIGRKEIAKFFEQEYGLSGIFSKEKQLQTVRDVQYFNEKLKGNVPEDDKPDPEPPKPKKSRLKYSF